MSFTFLLDNRQERVTLPTINDRQRIAVAIAGLLLIAATAWLFWPLPSGGENIFGNAIDCGNAIPGSGRGSFYSECDPLIADRRTQVLVLAGAGIAIGVGGYALFADRGTKVTTTPSRR